MLQHVPPITETNHHVRRDCRNFRPELARERDERSSSSLCESLQNDLTIPRDLPNRRRAHLRDRQNTVPPCPCPSLPRDDEHCVMTRHGLHSVKLRLSRHR